MPSTRRNTAATASQRCITGYGNISKPQVIVPVVQVKSKGKGQAKENDTLKRKRSVEHSESSSTKVTRIDVQDNGARCNRAEVQLGSSPKRCKTLQKTSVEIFADSTADRPELSPIKLDHESYLPPPPGYHAELPTEEAPTDLPEEIADLIDLYSSFLTALALHLAHHGVNNPADLRVLCPSISKTWRKRNVTINDIRQLLALQAQARLESPQDVMHLPTMSLVDYGPHKIMLEMEIAPGLVGRHRPLNEEIMLAVFRQSLCSQWHKLKQQQPKPGHCLENLFANIQLACITTSPALAKIRPLLAKGQARLTELKAGAIQTQRRVLADTSGNATPARCNDAVSSKSIFDRSSDLKSRLMTKELHQTTLPAALSPEKRARQYALQRAPDVALVLQSLSLTGQRHCDNDVGNAKIHVQRSMSFTMPTLVENVQNSLRRPVAKEEALRCIRELAILVPHWIVMRDVGKMRTVTIRGVGPDQSELAKQVDLAVKAIV